MTNHVFGFNQWQRLHESDEEMLGGQSSKEGRNNPEWIALVAKLKRLSYAPKVLTFNSYDGIPSQSLNWGTTKGPNGNYGMGMATTDSSLPNEQMDLFNSEDRKNQADMHAWWKRKGYSTDGTNIGIKFRDAAKLAADLEEFFKTFPPQ